MTKNLYFKNRLFILLAGIIVVFILGYSLPFLLIVGKICLIVFILLIAYDYYKIKKAASDIIISRSVAPKLSLSDETVIKYLASNTSKQSVLCNILDDLPEQLQIRDFNQYIVLSPEEDKKLYLNIRPIKRGEYHFGNINVYISTPNLSLLEYRCIVSKEQTVKVIPSVVQMKKYELQVHSKTATLAGIRKIRKIGENDEFEHIRAYAQGDNIKAINWKATSRRQQLMINQYQDSRSQPVFSVIDKGRSMKMPFNDLTLLDYAINSVLATSNIILKNYDKAGLITFSNKLDSFLAASSKTGQLEMISDSLYHQETDFKEPSYESLFYAFRKFVKRRSIVLLYTNFENRIDLNRQIKFLKSISKHHVLVVICFINSELDEFTDKTPTTTSEIYKHTMAGKLLMEKEQIMKMLKLQNINTILTRPEDLSIDVINKYLEIKSKRIN
jgi:uncharacterized protein (DUF58 family)